MSVRRVPPPVNLLLIHSPSTFPLDVFYTPLLRSRGPLSPVPLGQSIKSEDSDCTSTIPHTCITSKSTSQRTLLTCNSHRSTGVSLTLNFSRLPPSSSLVHTHTHTYPFMLNFAVKSSWFARAKRQMFPIEMRIDFPSGLRNQRFVHFHLDKKWRGALFQ